MSLILKEGAQRVLVSQDQHMAVCVDVVDLGVVETTWQNQKRQTHKCRVVWEVEEEHPETGKRMTIGRTFTASLGEKAALRGFLESWRGRPFTADELKGFDTEQLIGVNAVIQVVHTFKDGRTYDNVNSIMKPMKGTPKLPPSGEYVRVKDRTESAAGDGFPAALKDEDDDLPF